MADLQTLAPADIHIKTITYAIALAPTEPEQALTIDVYKALAALSAKTETSASYQVLLESLAKAHKAYSKAEIRKQVESFLRTTAAATQGVRDETKEGVTPWGKPVDGNVLAEEIKKRIERHCVLPAGAAVCIALWLMASYCINCFRLFPKLLLTSPQPRCGKSTLLELLAAFVRRPLIGSNITASVIFRAIETWGVSILMDEADTFIHGNEELRGIINSGHTVANAFVWRVEGDSGSREPVRFSTWAPMVIAMIKTPSDTILDRSIWCQLQRKSVDDTVERLPRNLNDECLDLRRQCQRWADDNSKTLEVSDPEMPESGNDRAEDNYRTLAAIADLIGGDWPTRIRNAYRQAVRAQTTADTGDLSLALLTDIRELINEKPEATVLASTIIVDRLNDMADRPWPTVTNGKELSGYRLSELLKPYGLKPSKRDSGGSQFRGYLTEQLKGACARYLSEQTLSTSDTPDIGVRVEGMVSDQGLDRTPSDEQGVRGRTVVANTLPPTDTLKNEGVRLKAYSDAVSYTRTPCEGSTEGDTDDRKGEGYQLAKSGSRGGVL